ncbi:hypothetical protein TRVL_01383 [Trypanosoma vivax]|nr:hypothetical protein TRVL_01383 [Trypanosoma vivax]
MEKEAMPAVLQWFEHECEPATAQSLTDALGSKFGKQLVQETLERCVSEQRLHVKDIKKTRVFFPSVSVADSCTEEERDTNYKRSDFIQQIYRQRSVISLLSTEVGTTSQVPTAAKRAATIAALSDEYTVLRQRLEALRKSTGKNVDSKRDISFLIHRYKKAREMWKERKRIALRVIDATLGDSCGPQDLSELFGLTTDEQANTSLVDTAVPLP